jgi:hypothetical protein
VLENSVDTGESKKDKIKELAYASATSPSLFEEKVNDGC